MNGTSGSVGRVTWVGWPLILLALVGVGSSCPGVFSQRGAIAQQAGEATSTHEDDEIRTAVETVIRTQEEAWNRGDVDAFVEHYWKSPDVTFSSGGTTTRGWMETRDRYRERYPTPEKMGQVAFSNLEITPLGDAAAMVLGAWSLRRESEPLSGNFTLVFRKLDGRWVIVHDHTSRLVE